MKKVVHKSALPIYFAAAVWILYALLLPLYSVWHFAIALAVSAVVYFVSGKLCKDIVEYVKEEEKVETTGNQELDKMIADGKLAIQEMKRLDDAIEDKDISDDIVHLEQVTEKIFAQVKQDPTKMSQIRRFMNYYLPTTLKLLNAYDRASAQGVQGENITGTMHKVSEMMDQVVRAFDHQLDALFGAEAMDISSDITVLENMMAREGLKSDIIHDTQKTATVPPQETDTL
jgi:5-bromo-4-chloroindolyl phosphate hydrolysis protein